MDRPFHWQSERRASRRTAPFEDVDGKRIACRFKGQA
jgi:hypothetical protein